MIRDLADFASLVIAAGGLAVSLLVQDWVLAATQFTVVMVTATLVLERRER